MSRVVCSQQPVHGIALESRTYVCMLRVTTFPLLPHHIPPLLLFPSLHTTLTCLSPSPSLPLPLPMPSPLTSLPLPPPMRSPHPFCPHCFSLPLPFPPPAGVQGRHLSHPVRVQCGPDPLEGLPSLPWLPQPPQAGHPGPLQGIWAVSWVTQRREEGEGGGFGTTPGGWGVCTTLL